MFNQHEYTDEQFQYHFTKHKLCCNRKINLQQIQKQIQSTKLYKTNEFEMKFV